MGGGKWDQVFGPGSLGLKARLEGQVPGGLESRSQLGTGYLGLGARHLGLETATLELKPECPWSLRKLREFRSGDSNTCFPALPLTDDFKSLNGLEPQFPHL